MYWLEIILWEFGAWKSFYTHRSITTFYFKDSIKIWNYSSPDFDLQFRSVNDFINILNAIYNFKKDPKNLDKHIEIIVDEWAIYFGNREFKSFPKPLLTFLVQLRKLNVSMKIIAQDLKMLDINFRRLCYNVRKYYKFLHFIRMYKDYELLSEDANLNDPINSVMSKPHFKFWPWLTVKIFWFRSKIFWSSLYDTNELIIPHYDILDFEKLVSLFPYTKNIDNVSDYKDYLKYKNDLLSDFVIKKKNIKDNVKDDWKNIV